MQTIVFGALLSQDQLKECEKQPEFEIYANRWHTVFGGETHTVIGTSPILVGKGTDLDAMRESAITALGDFNIRFEVQPPLRKSDILVFPGRDLVPHF